MPILLQACCKLKLLSGTVTTEMLQRTWLELDYRLDILRAAKISKGDSQRKCQNGYRAAEGTSLVPRKQINCNSSKNYSVGVSKNSIKRWYEQLRSKFSLTDALFLFPLISHTKA
ncbi:hypothetical protein AVEN_34825-1 [Araneus ventricosus]|uniref:Uncharacterized protein n=1 Tax=Araneus ventricosus TaxID=182803 RepID=A0A4Y2N6Q3_ARAVE|nr:hypothetical protein AVEN_34825-1 [Araneus ventricosus]